MVSKLPLTRFDRLQFGILMLSAHASWVLWPLRWAVSHPRISRFATLLSFWGRRIAQRDRPQQIVSQGIPQRDHLDLGQPAYPELPQPAVPALGVDQLRRRSTLLINRLGFRGRHALPPFGHHRGVPAVGRVLVDARVTGLRYRRIHGCAHLRLADRLNVFMLGKTAI